MERVAHEIEERGFSIVEDVVDQYFATRLRSALLIALEEDNKAWATLPGKRNDLIQNLAIYGGVFLELLENAVMHEVFQAFLAPAYILYNYGSTLLLPDGKPPATDIHVDMPRLIPNYHSSLIMTLALDNFTEENGATLYLPGSQYMAAPPDPDTFQRYAIRVNRKAGAAVFFNPRCFHKGGQNHTNQVRCAVSVYACRSYMKQRFDFPRMIAPEIATKLSPKLRQFIGFDSRVPSKMTEFYVGEEDRLYKPGQK